MAARGPGRRLIAALLDLLYPPHCPFCGRLLERDESGACARCRAALPRTGDGETRTVDFCDGCLAPLWYRDGVREAVHRYKFRGGQAHSRLFGQLMAQCLSSRWDQPIDAVTWVPLSSKRRRRRGYDQAELLARRVGELAGLPVEPLLVKTRDTAVQSRLTGAAARRANVINAYACRPGADLAGRRILLVDDVITTGSTAAECAACLRTAGAASVAVLALAWAGKDGK